MPATLLSSAPSLDDIRASIRDFYCGGSMTLIPVTDDEWRLVQTISGKDMEGVRVVRKRNRYRFEMLN